MPVLDVDSVVEALTVQFQDMGSAALHCPGAAPSRGVVSRTYEQWFRPYSLRRRHLPVSGGRMQLGLVGMACLLLLVVLLTLLMLIGLTGCA